MRRVMILGAPGSGKSTLARRMGQVLGLPVVHIDKIHHLPGWQERPRDEKIAMALAEQARPRWIIEGGLSATKQDRLARADTVIFLDLPLGLRLRRVVWRTLRWYGRTRPDMQEGCPERFRREFYRWIWDTRHSQREGHLALLDRAGAEKTVAHLRSPAQVADFVNGLRREVRQESRRTRDPLAH